jgi:hypothetical protein
MRREIAWVTLDVGAGNSDRHFRIRLLRPIEIATSVDADGICTASAFDGEETNGLRERIDHFIQKGKKINAADYRNTEAEAIASLRYHLGFELTAGVCMYARHDYTKKGMNSHRRFRKLIGPHVCDGWFAEWEAIGLQQRNERRFPILNMKKRTKR